MSNPITSHNIHGKWINIEFSNKTRLVLNTERVCHVWIENVSKGIHGGESDCGLRIFTHGGDTIWVDGESEKILRLLGAIVDTSTHYEGHRRG